MQDKVQKQQQEHKLISAGKQACLNPQDFCIQNPINNFDVEGIIECDDCNNDDGCCMGGCIQKYNHEEGCFNG